jgi:hypothetical protein
MQAVPDQPPVVSAKPIGVVCSLAKVTVQALSHVSLHATRAKFVSAVSPAIRGSISGRCGRGCD